ncbi:MAG: YfbM family protein [Gemmataceae bacterium]|nr:YfbM family protein [Planctomycetia bacterium]MBX3398563.1 YfbM family protein [Gemmataceae bacterium]
MSLGVHFALDKEQEKALLGAKSDRKLMALIEEIEEVWDEANLVETDKAWDGIHRCLTDGELLYDNGEYPLNHAVCGGRQLHRGNDNTVAYVTAKQTRKVAEALAAITKAGMRKRYATIDPDDYEFELCDEDFEYVWSNFLDLRRFYKSAAAAGRAVIFSTDC